MHPYLGRLFEILSEYGNDVQPAPPVAPDPHAGAPEVVGSYAAQLISQRMYELNYPRGNYDETLASLRGLQRAISSDKLEKGVVEGIDAIEAFKCVGTALEVGDVSLAARLASLIDPSRYRMHLAAVYEQLNALR